MLITVIKSKIAYATLTHTELYYEGSITIDEDLLDQANIKVGEKVQIVNLNNGERLDTYTIAGPRGSKEFGLNGPAARKGAVGDQVFIISYAQIDPTTDSIDPILVSLK